MDRQPHGEFRRRVDAPDRAAAAGAPLGRDNLRAAFPEKSDAEIERILGGVWDNLGRIGVEFAHLDEFSVAGSGPPTPDVITYAPETAERYGSMVASGQPLLGFAAHLANWELPAVVAKSLGANAAMLYRRPNIPAVSDIIVKLRAPLMGELDCDRASPRRCSWRGCWSPAPMSACWSTSILPKASK